MAHEPVWCPVFRPTKEEFSKPFAEYVTKIFKKQPGLPMFKVIPPEGWKARQADIPDLSTVTINTPIRQHVLGTKGAYRCLLIESKPMSVADFQKQAEAEEASLKSRMNGKRQQAASEGATDSSPSPDIMERTFWSNVTLCPPLYGADTPVSFFDEELPYGWNLRNLGDLLQTEDVPPVPGVTTPMTYFGMFRAFFSWHKEDCDLYSINYMHFGAPKVWYCVSPDHKDRFDRMAASLYPDSAQKCRAFIRHKDILISPALLRGHSIPYMQAKQEAGEFMVLNAAAYHGGFNTGFNCAEAVNFATKEWIPAGKAANRCTCHALKDCVRISMRHFDPEWRDSDDDSSDEEDSDEDGQEEEEEEVPVKRGRGRPRKRGRPPGSASAAQAGGRDSKRPRATPTPPGHDHSDDSGLDSGDGDDSDLESDPEAALMARSSRFAPRKPAGRTTLTSARALSNRGSSSALVRAQALAAARAAADARKRLFNGSSKAAAQAQRRRGSPPSAGDTTGSEDDASDSDGDKDAGDRSDAGAAGVRRRRGRPPASASAASAGEDRVVGAPAAIVGEDDDGQKFFCLVQVLDRAASKKGQVVLRWLKEGPDGLYRPEREYWEEAKDALVPVRVQQMGVRGPRAAVDAAAAGGDAGSKGGQPQVYKLLTLRSRILDTELVS